MVIIASREGQIGNRLWHASNFMASAKAHGYSIRYIHFDEYKKYFSSSIKNNPDQFPVRFGISGIRFVDAIARFALLGLLKFSSKTGIRNFLFGEVIINLSYEHGKGRFNLGDPEFIKKAKRKNVFVFGFQFFDDENSKRHSEKLKKFWTPDEHYLVNTGRVIAEAKQHADVLVGIHIRKGDYRTWNNGAWNYNLETYVEKMQQFLKLDEFRGKKISFLVCSDEKMDASAFKGFDVISGERHFIEDIYGLSRCDYIVGPPSTYSMWASFYGNTPLLMIKEKDQPVRMEDFKIIS